MCWLRWLMWMWFDFSLKLSTHSIRFNSSLRSFISFSETKKKLQSLHWERKRSRRSRWWRRSWRSSTDTSQLFHTQSKTWRRWWKTMTSAFYRSDFRSWMMIDWLMIDCDWWFVFVLQKFPVSMERCDLLVSLVSASEVPLQFWSWMFFQSLDLITAGSTDVFWSFDWCATLLEQPALQSLEEDAGHCSKQWVWRRLRLQNRLNSVKVKKLEAPFVILPTETLSLKYNCARGIWISSSSKTLHYDGVTRGTIYSF